MLREKLNTETTNDMKFLCHVNHLPLKRLSERRIIKNRMGERGSVNIDNADFTRSSTLKIN